jgi:hypothetical protein
MNTETQTTSSVEATTVPDIATDLPVIPSQEPQDQNNEMDQLRARVKELEAALIEKELDVHGVYGESRETWRHILQNTFEQGVQALSSLAKVQPLRQTEARKIKAPIHRSSSSAAPQPIQSMRQMQRDAIEKYRRDQCCTYREAFNAVQRMRPELFNEAVA